MNKRIKNAVNVATTCLIAILFGGSLTMGIIGLIYEIILPNIGISTVCLFGGLTVWLALFTIAYLGQ